jgi:hypothetical protein
MPHFMRASVLARNTQRFAPWIVAAIGSALCLVAVWIM